MTLPFRFLALAGCTFLLGGFLGLSVALRTPDGAASSDQPIEAGESVASGLPATAARPPEPLELPDPGAVIVRSGSGGTSVFANDAPRFDVLLMLASSLDFELIDSTDTNPKLTLRLANLTVEEVLTRVLDDTPYRLRYDVAQNEAGVEIASLEVASRRYDFRPEDDFDVAAGDDSRRNASPPESGRKNVEERVARMGPRRVLDEVARRQFEDERAARNERRHAEMLGELSATDPETRAFAASNLDAANPEDRNHLAAILASDPNPEVRREAALQLGYGHGPELLAALEGALADSDDGVVGAALDSIGFVGDPNAISMVEPFLSHDNPMLSNRAQETTALLSLSR